MSTSRTKRFKWEWFRRRGEYSGHRVDTFVSKNNPIRRGGYGEARIVRSAKLTSKRDSYLLSAIMQLNLEPDEWVADVSTGAGSWIRTFRTLASARRWVNSVPSATQSELRRYSAPFSGASWLD